MKNIRGVLVLISILVIISISAGTVSATNDTTAPHVSDFNPDNNEDNVVGNKLIQVTFTEPMQTGTEWVELKDASNGASISISKAINGNVLTISHNTLLTHGKTYNLLLHTGCYNDLAGNQLASTSSSFTIENKVPVVSDFNPDNNASNVVGNKLIRVTFNETMQTGTEWVELKDASNGASISISKAINGNVLTISHNTLLTHGKTYNLILHTGCYNDLAGNQLLGTSSSFKIESTAPNVSDFNPDNNGDNVVGNKLIQVTFTEPMQTGTEWVELKDASNGASISISKAINGNVLTISHNTLLTHGKTYNLILHTGSYNDLAGNQLVGTSSSFTIENTAPFISSMDPVNGATNVAADKVITVTFSEAMQTGTGNVELNDANGNPIPITKSLGSRILTITPNDYLNHGSYNLIFNTGCYKDLASNNLVLVGKSFTVESIAPTVSSYDPINGAVNIPLNKVIKVNFNEPIQEGNNFTELKGNDGSSVATTNTVNGNILTLTPNTLLNHGIIYTLFLHTGSYTDLAGNPIAICNNTFSVENLILNINTNNTYSNIQDAINAASAQDTIQLFTGTYTENIVINKTLTLRPVSGGNVTIHPLNPSNPIFIVNSLGSGTIIQGFNINGATVTGSAGIYLYGSSNCKIIGNILTINHAGIVLNGTSNSNAILNNSIINNSIYGIRINDSSNATVTGNIITGNFYGINTQGNSSATIQFNIITGNGAWGIVNQDTSTVNAINNWWGSNYPIVNLVAPSDICIQGGTVTYNPRLVLNVTAKHTGSGDYEITGDLTQNNNENSTSSSGNVPDGIPVNFTTTYGTIGNTCYTRKGKAILILNSNISGLANVTATLNNQNVTKTVYLGAVYNINSQKGFNSIQAAINDSSTSTNDTIEIYNKTYNENIIVNKRVNIVSATGTNPLIIGAITINYGGNGSIIQGLTINGNINLYANNCSIYRNTVIGNGTSGIIVSNSLNNTISFNEITANGFNGIQSNSSSNTIYGNTIYSCESGIYSENSNDNITSNNLYDNNYAIWTYNSTDIIKFNRITGNTYGLRNDIGTVNATNNWWGSNNNPSSPSDIWIVSGNVIHDTWLVLNVNASSTNSGGNTSVTADLTHNNQGVNTVSQGFIPDGTIVNFNTNPGTIVNQAYTIRGQAETILHLNTMQSITVNVSASADNQSVSTTRIISTGIAVLNITSTAIDNSTGQPLNITYNIPLNNSVTWLSIIWIPTTIPNNSAKADELQVILNGTVVLNRFIYNNGQNTDTLTFNLAYPGLAGRNITVVDPINNNTINLNFPGNFVNRTSQITYNGTPYEGLRSFAITTTEVTPDIFNYWLNQHSLYQSGTMEVPYSTFLTALMVEYVHDQLADNITTQCNVTWSRTSPIIVSVCDEPYETYLTLECDHSMGMTVVGTVENMRTFNYITSSSISPIEYAVLNSVSGLTYQSYSINGYFGSVTMDLLNDYFANSTSVEAFTQNGYIIEKSVSRDYDFIVIDPETGIVRDINIINNFCGAIIPTVPYEKPLQCISAAPDPHIGYPDTFFGNPWNLGTYNIDWDGTGQVLIASNYNSDPANDMIWTIGELIVTGPLKSVHFNEANPAGQFFGSDLDITSTLPGVPGTNIINISLYASPDNRYGKSSLWVIQTSLKNTGYHGINATTLIQLGQNLVNGVQHFNIKKFTQIGRGVITMELGGIALFAGILGAPETVGTSLLLLLPAIWAEYDGGNTIIEAMDEPTWIN